MSKELIEVEKIRTAYAVYSNTDLNEGRGSEYLFAICKTKITAERLGDGNYVAGTDCPVREVDVFEYMGMTYGPVFIHQPTQTDIHLQEQKKKCEEAERKKLAAVERARNLGLSEEDLTALMS